MGSMEAKSAIAKELVDKLALKHCLELEEYELLVSSFDCELAAYAASLAVDACLGVYGKNIYVRGLIEFSNYCKNNCYYCGIRAENKACERYRLTNSQILECADEGYKLGYRTIVLQSGEDEYYTDEILCNLISALKEQHQDCAVTLSVGERSAKSYQLLRAAGADRYLLRHETANKAHYEKLHPKQMSWQNRMDCLQNLKDCGFCVGAGFIVGSPYQSAASIAQDLKFIEQFKPQMCGIGPFVPHHATQFAKCEAGSVDLTCYLLSLIRLIQPNILLPATTALATLAQDGRERGILSGANVVMPNLSPCNVRKKYEIYDNKACTGEEAATSFKRLKASLSKIDRNLIIDRGDPKPLKEVL